MRQALRPLDTNNITTDRFIPLRSFINEGTGLLLTSENPKGVLKQFNEFVPDQKRILNYQKKDVLKQVECKAVKSPRMKKKSSFPKKPIKVLEAPGLIDDYYLNLVCWSKSNLIAVGLEDSVYFFNFLNNKVKKHVYLP